MIQRILSSLNRGGMYVRTHPQLLMTLVLVIVIPVAFLLSGQQFLDVAKDTEKKSERERIGILHDVFTSLLFATDFDMEIVEREIQRIAVQNPDLVSFRVLKEETDGSYRALASMTPAPGTEETIDVQLMRLANIEPGTSVEIPYTEYGVRYRTTIRLVISDTHGAFYIYTTHSLQAVDALFATRVQMAYYWLGGLLLLVLLLVLRHVKLIDYRYLYNEAQKANQTRDLFTNMITHELRAPLTAIRGYASMIREDSAGSEKIHQEASRIEESASRLVVLVNDLLDVARIQSGKMDLEMAPVDISALVASVYEELRPTAAKKNIALYMEGLHEAVHINTDQKRLHQVLVNLVSNALKYTKEGSVTIEYTAWKDRDELRVKDTGMGIDAGNQKQLFAPFFRVQDDTVDTITGTGLGMWITKQLVELMGASIALESIRGVGTHVIVTFPKTKQMPR